MDLVATRLDQGLAQLNPSSVHGVFWLQTHFPAQEWDALLSGQAAFGMDCVDDLINDAREAGLNVKWEASVRS
ncbi:hypothetical protein [Parasynechococcus sp.]|uniref:hypothetical protein n=1 Tax=Parasynechococcus sp. TaxID=3101203 RepID=UPI003703C445